METQTLEVGRAPRLRLTAISGDLRLSGRAGVALEARAAPRGGLRVTPQGEQVEVCCDSACLLFVPENAEIEIDLIGGDARLIDLCGELRIGAVGGDLSLRRVGAAAIGRVTGDMVVHRACGELAVGAVGGDAHIEHIEGPARLGQLGGDLKLLEVLGAVEAEVGGDASIVLDPPPGTRSAVRAGGDMVCRLPAGASAALALQAGGTLRADLPGEQRQQGEVLHVRLGEAAAEVELSAGADLVVRAAAAADEGAWGREILGADFDEQIRRQVDDALSQVEQSLAGLGAGAAGSEAARVSERVRREVERAQRHVARARVRAGGRTGGPTPGGRGGDPREAERLAVLQMLEQGAISAAEAEQLLRALEGAA